MVLSPSLYRLSVFFYQNFTGRLCRSSAENFCFPERKPLDSEKDDICDVFVFYSTKINTGFSLTVTICVCQRFLLLKVL